MTGFAALFRYMTDDPYFNTPCSRPRILTQTGAIMKKKLIAYTLLLFIPFSHSCTKRNPSTLPQASQTGANFFACLINGKVFTNGGSVFTGVNLMASYTHTYRTPLLPDSPARDPSGWQLLVTGTDQRNTCKITQITLELDSIPATEGETYPLVAAGGGRASARHNRFACDSINHFDSTRFPQSGALHITRLDTAMRIMSGVFNYTVVDDYGIAIVVTDGRFDIKY